ncbi:MAG: phosphoribosylanthranilate isomerase [Alphaproteobacteria bacterium]|nr:phosphoribosylanthranilate isomerase [Alphaproteobacteria bacterium]
MSAQAKICGISTEAAMDAAIAGGAAFVGLVFALSPRRVSPARASQLAARVPGGIQKIGLFVEPEDAEIEAALEEVALDMVQLHGHESAARTAEIKANFGLPVMKAIGVKGPEDLARAHDYDEIADYLLFDGLGDPDSPIPGGNAAAFDWTLLAGRRWPVPWMLAGGLTPENVARAIEASGAELVDVSSGVEAVRGQKDPALITAFLETVARG